MNHANLELYFKIAQYAGLPIGVLVLSWWGVKVYERRIKKMEGRKFISMSEIAIKMVFFMLPGIFLFILCCIPMLYFNFQLKQYDHCETLIEVNSLNADDPILAKRCGNFDIAELMRNAKPDTLSRHKPPAMPDVFKDHPELSFDSLTKR